MPLPTQPNRKGDRARQESPASPGISKADKELLFKGILCALIGLCVLIAPYVARSPDVQQLMGSAATVGWFALALGCAFIVLVARRRWTASRST